MSKSKPFKPTKRTLQKSEGSPKESPKGSPVKPSPSNEASSSYSSKHPAIHKKDYSKVIKDFFVWLISPAGGGQAQDNAKQMIQQAQDVMNSAGVIQIGDLTEEIIIEFIETNERKEPKERKKSATMLKYLIAIENLVTFGYLTERISTDKQKRMEMSLKRLSSSLRKKSKEETVKRRVQEDRQKVPAEARSFFFKSKWVDSIKKRLNTAVPSTTHSRDLIEYRNFLIIAIALWNGQRPMPIRLMSFDDVSHAKKTITDGPENEEDRTYMVMSVAGHKTAKTWGEAHFSIPPWLYQLLLKYTHLICFKYGFDEEKCVFRTESGTRLEQSSTVNQAIQAAWRASGSSSAFPGSFTCTSNRKLITTVVRNKDPNLAPLIASQLTHSVQTADRIYATERSKQLSSAAVHVAMKAMEETGKTEVKMDVGQTEEKVEEKGDDRSMDVEQEVQEAYKLGINFEKIHEGMVREDFTEEFFIQLNLLPFEQIERDANYWALQGGLEELSRLTSLIEIVISFRRTVQKLFAIDVFTEIECLGAMPLSLDPAVRLAVSIFSLAGIAESFGADRRPFDAPTNRPLSRREIFQMGNVEEKKENSDQERSPLKTKKRRITARYEIPEISPDSKSNKEDEDVPISNPNPSDRKSSVVKKRSKFPDNFNERLISIFKAELEESIENSTHIKLGLIRPHLQEIRMVYPEATVQQVRDKLYNITKSERKTRGLTPVKSPGNTPEKMQ